MEEWEGFENNLFNEQVTQRRKGKLKYLFKVVKRGLNKDFAEVTRGDIENFVNDLNRDIFRKENGEVYSGSTKSDIKKFLKQFWKWYKGDNEVYPKEVSWIKTRIGRDEQPEEKEILNYEEVIRLANSFTKIECKIMVLLLFDSGFRIQELLSVKKKDISLDKFDEEGNKCYWLKCNVSKTIIRKIDVPLFTEELRVFCNSTYFNNLGSDDLVFKMSYSAFHNVLNDNSKKVLGKKISPHNLRHSSATYYAGIYNGNSMMLANRYGWTYSSKELNTYIRRSGSFQREAVKVVYKNELLKLKEENETLKERMTKMEKMLKEQLEFSGKIMEAMSKNEKGEFILKKDIKVS